MQTPLCKCGLYVESCSHSERDLNSGYTASISRYARAVFIVAQQRNWPIPLLHSDGAIVYIRCPSLRRCFNSVTGSPYAVKKIPVSVLAEDSQALVDEVRAQQAAAAHQVPRVVQLFAAFRAATDEVCLVME